MASGNLIVYASVHHGNTERVAEAMADELDAALQPPGVTSVEDVAGADLVGFGSGIYFWRHHRSLLRLVQRLPAMPAKKAFVFSTRGGFPRWIGHRRLKKLLHRRGFTLADEFSCKGYDTYGPLKIFGGINRGRPNQKDIAKARRFAARLADEQVQHKG